MSDERVAVVIAAGRGMGAACAESLAEAGYRLVLMSNGGGAIVNISTTGAVQPEPNFPVSSTIRAGLGAFARLYAAEHAPRGIRMNNVLPGFVDSYPEAGTTLRAIPAGRYARVQEIAATVTFLLSDAAAYITGQSIRVDGGLTRAP